MNNTHNHAITHKPLHHFMLGVLVFFPLTFYLWYMTAGLHLAPVTLLTGKVLGWLTPDAIMWLKLDGHNLVLAANFGHAANGTLVSPPIGDDALGFQSNPLVYSYGMPLLCALILATPCHEKWFKLLWGMIILLPIEVFSMTFKILKTLAFDVGTAFLTQQHIGATGADMIALGYQIGTLLLPMIAPLIIWFVLQRDFITQLAPQLEQAFKA